MIDQIESLNWVIRKKEKILCYFTHNKIHKQWNMAAKEEEGIAADDGDDENSRKMCLSFPLNASSI